MAWITQRTQKDSTVIIEAMADHENWIWHAFLEMPGSCSDINVLQRSPLMTHIALNEGPPVECEANGCQYNCGYFLADDIYPRWSIFVEPTVKPKGKKNLDFHNAYAAARKDVERDLGFVSPICYYGRTGKILGSRDSLYIMSAYVIMHNRIIKNECDKDLDYTFCELMGHPVRVQRREERVAYFIHLYHAISKQ
jgi:hypothetical protein